MKRVQNKKWIVWVLGTLLVLLLACAIYVGDYYHADTAAIEAFLPENTVEMTQEKNKNLIFSPEGADTGFIFYPGGKVEHTAYIPLMEAISSQGILCVLVQMPFNLAVLDSNAAADIPAQYPQIENWYIGGHSLGGSMAATHAAEHTDLYRGLVLLGAYSTADLRASGLEVLSLYGSEDLVMNREKYEKYRANLPDGFTEIVIDGGCHAFFGMYGFQAGDGTPSITNESQILQTAACLAAMAEKE